MKILFLEAVQNFGGARKSTLELADRLQSRGNEVLVVDFWGSCVPFVDDANKRNVPITVLDKREEPFLLKDFSKIKTVKNYMVYFKLWLSYRKKAKIIIRDFGAELIVVNNAKTLSILSKSDTYKIAYFARGWFLPRTVSLFNKKLIKRLVSIFIGVSQSTRQAIYAGGFAELEDIYVVPNAIDIEEIEKSLKSSLAVKLWHEEGSNRPFTILHCGGFLETKGQHIVVEIAKELKRKEINFKILLVGVVYKGNTSGKYYNNIIESIQHYGLKESIEVVLNKTNVTEYFAQSDLLMHPSCTEGLPRVAMEAMSLGKPVVGNAVGGMTDYILNGFTGYLTNFNNVDDYLEAILKLVKDKEHYKFVSLNAKKLISNSYNLNSQLSYIDNILKIIKVQK